MSSSELVDALLRKSTDSSMYALPVFAASCLERSSASWHEASCSEIAQGEMNLTSDSGFRSVSRTEEPRTNRKRSGWPRMGARSGAEA